MRRTLDKSTEKTGMACSISQLGVILLDSMRTFHDVFAKESLCLSFRKAAGTRE